MVGADETILAKTTDAGLGSSDRELAVQVLSVVAALSEELHPHQKGRALGLERDLNRDFGLDSLGRVEAIHRLEALFNTTLPDRLFAEASTPSDLVRAIAAAGPSIRPAAGPAEARVAPGASAAPEHLQSLVDVLAWHGAHQGERVHVYLSDGDKETASLTYAELLAKAQRVAAGLIEKGSEPGARIGLMLPTGVDFFAAFMGVLMAGSVPAPIYPPWRLTRLEDHLRRQARILATAGVAGLITFEPARPFADLLKAHVPSLAYLATTQEIEADPGRLPNVRSAPEDLALLQFTSGSTADPKGVMLSHANVLANIRALAYAIRATPADVYVSWLPLYHDMGLIAAWLACLDQAVPMVVMSPLSFLAKPERWLWTAARNRATITAAPNFAFELCLSVPDSELSGLDLGALRVAGCGSEPVSARTLSDFTNRFAAFGFRADALLPVYGLAENAAALTASLVGRPPRVDLIHRRALAINGEAKPATSDAPDAQAFVSCGAPLIGHEVRILGPDGRETPERREGRLQFRGPSATRGYFNAPEKTAELIREGWLESGDLAYIADGEVFVTGRTKDIVKRAGRNIHPADVETAVCGLDGVTPNGAVLFSSSEPARGTERLVLALETPLKDEGRRRALVNAAQELAADNLEGAPDEVVLMPLGAIPRTESGKIRRAAVREAYERWGGAGPMASAREQLLRLQASAMLGRLRRAARSAAGRLYAAYWWGVIGLEAIVLWPLLMVLPGLPRRWRVMRGVSRLSLRLLGHRLTVVGERPMLRRAVYVANHSSYLDSVVLSALLPGEPAFAAYGELAAKPFQGRFVRRLGVMFVERFEPRSVVAEASKALGAFQEGRPLVFFPEATILRMPGLLDFRLGAFTTAAQADAPVIPITIRGTRNILRHDHRWFPHRGAIEVDVGPPLQPQGSDFAAALALRNAARSEILAHVHEPDLAAETPVF